MAVFGVSLYLLFEWFWRRLLSLWRYLRPVFLSVVGFTRRAITWGESSSARSGAQVEEGICGAEVGQTECELPGYGDPIIQRWQEDDDEEMMVEVKVEEEEEEEVEAVEAVVVEMEEEEEEEEEEEMDGEMFRVESTDEFYCAYDSTWETDDSPMETDAQRRRTTSSHYNFKSFDNAARDMYNYRHDYPMQPRRWRNPTSNEMPNFKFYCGQQHSEPDRVYIQEFHQNWFGRYDKLESVHTYIQWLFPLQEPGVNYDAHPLTKTEITAFLESDTAKKNLLMSYLLMLDFYGIQLESKETGEVRRAWNWAQRSENLNMNTHNNLRLTRILKCLGTLGYPHYQAPLVRFFLEEALVHKTLPNVKNSVLNYFLFAVLDKKQRRKLVKFAFSSYDYNNEFVWCPRKLQRLWSRSPKPKEN